MKLIKISIVTCIFIATLFSTARAELKVSDNDTRIIFIAVNGGADSPNSGTTCIKVSDTISINCASGYIAIPNNNKELLSSAFQAKATNGNIWLNYEDASPSQHCPGLVRTACTVSSIGLR